jgi:hypothetical protein
MVGSRRAGGFFELTSRYPGTASDDVEVVAGGRTPWQSTGMATGIAPAATPIWPGPLPSPSFRDKLILNC